MYPRTYFEAFMRYEASDQVFVAMPFSNEFGKARDAIIRPAITEAGQCLGIRLKTNIVNMDRAGAPDIHVEILDGIMHSRLFIADMTIQASHRGDHNELRWQPNANVAYEVGLACAWRNPEDVLLIYGNDKEHSFTFDVRNLRHVPYAVRDVTGSVRRLVNEIVSAIRGSQFIAEETWKKLRASLSPSAIQYMRSESCCCIPMVNFPSKEMPTMTSRLEAIAELVECGALKVRFVDREDEREGVKIYYDWSELGLRLLVSFGFVTETWRNQAEERIRSLPHDSAVPDELRYIPSPGVVLVHVGSIELFYVP